MKTMILYHVTEFGKFAIFWVVMVLSDNFTVRVSTISVAENDDSEASDSVL